MDRANGSRTSGRTVPGRCRRPVRQATAGSVPATGDGPQGTQIAGDCLAGANDWASWCGPVGGRRSRLGQGMPAIENSSQAE